MKYAKLINGYPSYAPNPIVVGEVRYGNPSDMIYQNMGYKPITYKPQPEQQGNGYYNEIWSETENEIIQGWEWIENNEVDADEAMEILFGGEY